MTMIQFRFSEITQRAIVNAVRNLTRIDQRTADAVYCRTELDLRIGGYNCELFECLRVAEEKTYIRFYVCFC